jgi:methionyl-tRNA synthetase
MAAGVRQPRGVIAHGMWVDPNGRKMSKTVGNVIELDVLNKHFPIDSIRYFCLREMVFGQDGRFGYEALIDRTNSDLASGLGNLSSRTLTMISRYCESKIPSGVIPDEKLLNAKRAGFDTDETTISGFVESARRQILEHLDGFAFSKALEVAWSIVARADKMISDAKPWELAKDENQKETLGAVLYRSAEALRWLSVLLYPIMPGAMEELWKQLGLSGSPRNVNPVELKWGDLKSETTIGEVLAIFPRLDKVKTMKEIENKGPATGEKQVESSEAKVQTEGSGVHATEADAVPQSSTAISVEKPPQHATEAEAVPGVASYIDISDFVKVDLRVGQVLTAERIPKADKLLLLSVDVGEETPRTILAGIAEYYEPESMVGRKIAVVSNLKPRKMRGHESQGMLLAASVGEGNRPVLATFTEDVPNGARLK